MSRIKKEEALDILWMPVAGDKTKTIFASLVAAMLNEASDTDTSCLGDAIDDANAWFESYPVCSGVGGGSDAWARGIEGLHTLMDDYNNGYVSPAPITATTRTTMTTDDEKFTVGYD